MKGRVIFLSKIAIVAAVFAQTTTADTVVLPMIGTNGLNEPLYLTLCGIGLFILGARNNKKSS